jgi:hypothetical protein
MALHRKHKKLSRASKTCSKHIGREQALGIVITYYKRSVSAAWRNLIYGN